jgi:hypothetical protein
MLKVHVGEPASNLSLHNGHNRARREALDDIVVIDRMGDTLAIVLLLSLRARKSTSETGLQKASAVWLMC